MKYKYLICIFFILFDYQVASQEHNTRVVRIQTRIGGDTLHGSGYFYQNDRQILTAYHVVHRAHSITVLDSRGRSYLRVRIIAAFPSYDLALLQITGRDRSGRELPEEIYDDDSYDTNVRISTIGFPRSSENYLTLTGHIASSGLVSSTETFHSSDLKPIFGEDIDVIPVDLTIYGGLSGAPVFYRGKLLGIVSGSLNEGSGLAWVIPVTYLDSEPSFENVAPHSRYPWPPFELMNPDMFRSIAASDREPLPQGRLAVRLSGGSTWNRCFATSIGISWLRQNYARSLTYGLQTGLIRFDAESEYQTLSGVSATDTKDSMWLLDAGLELGVDFFKVRPEVYFNLVLGPCVSLTDAEYGVHAALHMGIEVFRGAFLEVTNSLSTLPYDEIDFTYLGEADITTTWRLYGTTGLGIRYEI